MAYPSFSDEIDTHVFPSVFPPPGFRNYGACHASSCSIHSSHSPKEQRTARANYTKPCGPTSGRYSSRIPQILQARARSTDLRLPVVWRSFTSLWGKPSTAGAQIAKNALEAAGKCLGNIIITYHVPPGGSFGFVFFSQVEGKER